MRLKIYELQDPINGGIFTVYEYPYFLMGGVYSPLGQMVDCTLVSKEPLKIPILIVPNIYLKEKDGQRESSETTYLDMQYLDYWEAELDKKKEEKKKNDKLSVLHSMFPNLLESCKLDQTTMFFTGPKLVYKKTFKEQWAWVAGDRFALTGIGLFRTIESLSMKSPNELFITGTFECGDEVLENTQCKINIKKK